MQPPTKLVTQLRHMDILEEQLLDALVQLKEMRKEYNLLMAQKEYDSFMEYTDGPV